MNKRNNIIIVLLAAGLLSTLLFLFFKPGEKTGYVDLNKLFSEFKMKKELEVQLEKIKSSRKNILDSLEFNLKVLITKIDAEGQKDKTHLQEFEWRKQEYLEKKKKFEEDNDAVGKQYDQQIISQMNQYVKDYGNKHGYTYIFGADGSGFLMFSKDAKNITDEVREYINERYKGKTE
jgi:outer membrane protein